MRNVYNKAGYRSGEWAKHLRPYLKAKVNRKWRKNASLHIEQEIKEYAPIAKSLKKKKLIEARYTIKIYNNKISTRKDKYYSIRDALNSLNRPSVVRWTITKLG